MSGMLIDVYEGSIVKYEERLHRSFHLEIFRKAEIGVSVFTTCGRGC